MYDRFHNFVSFCIFLCPKRLYVYALAEKSSYREILLKSMCKQVHGCLCVWLISYSNGQCILSSCRLTVLLVVRFIIDSFFGTNKSFSRENEFQIRNKNETTQIDDTCSKQLNFKPRIFLFFKKKKLFLLRCWFLARVWVCQHVHNKQTRQEEEERKTSETSNETLLAMLFAIQFLSSHGEKERSFVEHTKCKSKRTNQREFCVFSSSSSSIRSCIVVGFLSFFSSPFTLVVHFLKVDKVVGCFTTTCLNRIHSFRRTNECHKTHETISTVAFHFEH